MGLNIDVGKARQSLLKQRDEIEEKLKALDIVENMADTLNNYNTEDGVDNSKDFNSMTIIDAAKSIFEKNPYAEFTVSDIMLKLRKGGKKGNYNQPTISNTLKRLVDRGEIQKRLHGNKNRFKIIK